MTPFITARDKRIITAVLSLQVVVNIALVVEETTMPGFVYVRIVDGIRAYKADRVNRAASGFGRGTFF